MFSDSARDFPICSGGKFVRIVFRHFEGDVGNIEISSRLQINVIISLF